MCLCVYVREREREYERKYVSVRVGIRRRCAYGMYDWLFKHLVVVSVCFVYVHVSACISVYINVCVSKNKLCTGCSVLLF